MDTWRSVSTLDRVDELRRDHDWVASQWAGAQVLDVTEDGMVASDEHSELPAPVPANGEFDAQKHFLLGRADGAAWFARAATVAGPVASLRQLGGVLTGLPLELVVGAVALTAWHRLEPHCPQCGHLTVVGNGGTVRHCPGCGRTHFPRQDPAVIVAVLDPDDRILLGRQASWDPGRVSVLAGFVEAGESLEQAVHREVMEESGVALGQVHYLGSQPWPFPRSLMLGFEARAIDTRLRVNHDEIEDAGWYSRDDLETALRHGRLKLPSPASIAHRLIAGWRGRDQSWPTDAYW